MKLVLFCDYGLDDAAATADALAHAARDGYARAVLVAVGGNVPPEVSLRNAKKLLARLAPCSVPVDVVDTTAEEQPFEFLKDIHGEDGMGNLLCAEADVRALPFAAWLEGFEGEYDLLSLGPATLVVRLLGRVRPRKFVLMGGNIAETPNFHGYEFNHALDRAAFSAAVRFPHVAVTMDTCRVPPLNIRDDPPEGGGLLGEIARRAREMTFVSGEEGSYLWDDIAVKALRHPGWFTTEARTDRDGNLLTVARYTLGKRYADIMLL